jgi:hypothetical protein
VIDDVQNYTINESELNIDNAHQTVKTNIHSNHLRVHFDSNRNFARRTTNFTQV